MFILQLLCCETSKNWKIQHLLNFICADREAFPCSGIGVCNIVYKDGKPPKFHLQNTPQIQMKAMKDAWGVLLCLKQDGLAKRNSLSIYRVLWGLLCGSTMHFTFWTTTKDYQIACLMLDFYAWNLLVPTSCKHRTTLRITQISLYHSSKKQQSKPGQHRELYWN